jgi:hypothetical protein
VQLAVDLHLASLEGELLLAGEARHLDLPESMSRAHDRRLKVDPMVDGPKPTSTELEVEHNLVATA